MLSLALSLAAAAQYPAGRRRPTSSRPPPPKTQPAAAPRPQPWLLTLSSTGSFPVCFSLRPSTADLLLPPSRAAALLCPLLLQVTSILFLSVLVLLLEGLGLD